MTQSMRSPSGTPSTPTTGPCLANASVSSPHFTLPGGNFTEQELSRLKWMANHKAIKDALVGIYGNAKVGPMEVEFRIEVKQAGLPFSIGTVKVQRSDGAISMKSPLLDSDRFLEWNQLEDDKKKLFKEMVSHQLNRVSDKLNQIDSRQSLATPRKRN